MVDKHKAVTMGDRSFHGQDNTETVRSTSSKLSEMWLWIGVSKCAASLPRPCRSSGVQVGTNRGVTTACILSS